jgi:hypothetical protein
VQQKIIDSVLQKSTSRALRVTKNDVPQPLIAPQRTVSSKAIVAARSDRMPYSN